MKEVIESKKMLENSGIEIVSKTDPDYKFFVEYSLKNEKIFSLDEAKKELGF